MKRIIVLLFLLLAAMPARAQDAFLTALPGLGGGFGAQVTRSDSSARLVIRAPCRC